MKLRFKLIIMIIVLISITSVTYAYVITQSRTNDVIFNIGGPDITGVTLTALYESDVVLVPKHVTTSSVKEVKYLQFSLLVESKISKNYHLDTVLPPEFQITTDRVGFTYSTGVTYTITLELLQEVDYSNYTFYLYINYIA